MNPIISETNKTTLEQGVLRDVIDLSLWAGQLLLHNGAASKAVEETVHRLGTALGADWMDVVVLTGAVVVTVNSGLEFRTKARRVVSIRVNMQVLDDINALTRRASTETLERDYVRQELRRISDADRNYNRWTTALLVGLACAAFSQLFGGGLPEFIVTFVAVTVAMRLRQFLLDHHFNALMIVLATAFVAGIGASAAVWFTATPEHALAASVLMLVPGVPLIIAAEDLIEGNITMGVVRGIAAAVTLLALALGLLSAITLTGVVF